MIIEKINHYPGLHCASTGIRNLLSFQGISWSEAFCFGLGAGLGIWYIEMPGMSPCRLIHVRSADIEKEFFTRIGHPFKWQQHDDPEAGERALCDCLDKGEPVIIQSDIFHLPYYNTKTHFPGHVITVWGYDRKGKVFYITDTEREEILEVPFDNMRKARYCKLGFFDIKGNLFSPGKLSVPEDFPDTIVRAIKANSNAMFNSPGDFGGLAGLEKWQNELPEWGSLDDWKWVARFTYQVIEKRGTGGGGFRFLYSDFLREAESFVPEIKSRGLSAQMQSLGTAWRDLAMGLKHASEENSFKPEELSDKLMQVKDLETAYHRAALSLGR